MNNILQIELLVESSYGLGVENGVTTASSNQTFQRRGYYFLEPGLTTKKQSSNGARITTSASEALTSRWLLSTEPDLLSIQCSNPKLKY